MSEKTLVTTVLVLARSARARETEFATGLSDAERAVTGKLDDWSAKDLIAHLATWKTHSGAVLAAVLGDELPPAVKDINERNQMTFEEWRDRPWDQVLAAGDRAFARLEELLPQLTDDTLLDPARFAWRRGQALAPTIVRPIYWHPMLHLLEFYTIHEVPDASARLQRDLQAAAETLAPYPELRGNTLYMLADSYAGQRRATEALAALREALALAPQLVPWSQRDPGLTWLRSEPGYAAILGELPNQ